MLPINDITLDEQSGISVHVTDHVSIIAKSYSGVVANPK